MDRFQEILGIVTNAASRPLDTAKSATERTGRKAVGCFKGYVPEELIHSFGMLPVGLWGAPVELSECRRYFPVFYCAPIQQNLELAIRGELDFLCAVIIPAHCDTLKAVGQNWKVAAPHIPFLPLSYPHNRRQDFGKRFLYTEYEEIIRRLEELSGKAYNPRSLWRSIAAHNRYRAALRSFLEVAPDYPDTVGAVLRHQVCAAGLVLDKAEYAPLLEELVELLRRRKQESNGNRRIVIAGTMLDNERILRLIDQNGLTVVADDLLQESRQLRCDVEEDGEDPVWALVERWAAMEGCALLYDPEKKRGDMLLQTVRDKQADGVLFCMTTFCDPEDYDYPLLRGLLQRGGVPTGRIDLSEADTTEQARTRIQGFAEMLR